MKSSATSYVSTPVLANQAVQAAHRYYLLAAVLMLATLLAFPFDLPVTAIFRDLHEHGPGDLKKAITVFEFFGHGIGAIVVILAAGILDRSRCGQMRLLLACAFGAGAANFVIKLLVGRTRPQVYWSSELPSRWGETFGLGTIWPNVMEGHLAVEHSLQSFPSGHSALVAGLAAGLALLYPQGRTFFAVLALLAMLQRVHCGAHYPSDTLAGAAVGVLTAAICYDPRLLGRWLMPRPAS